jgi:hypothetical protein
VRTHRLSASAVRWLAVAGTGGAFVLGLAGQAVRSSHETPATGRTVARAAIAADVTAAPPAGAPGLRQVTIPGLKAAPRKPKPRVSAPPSTSSIPVSAPVPVPTPAAPVVAPAAPPPAPAPAPRPAPKPAKGPSFDSSG